MLVWPAKKKSSLTKSWGEWTFQLWNMQIYSHACRHFHLQCNKVPNGVLLFFIIKKPGPTVKAVTPLTKINLI